MLEKKRKKKRREKEGKRKKKIGFPTDTEGHGKLLSVARQEKRIKIPAVPL